MFKKVIACDKCGETIMGEYLTVYRIDSVRDAVKGRGDICVKCYKIMLIALKDSGRWKDASADNMGHHEAGKEA